ncbi:MAG: pseudaminic acid synthase [Candidatus Bathyarchaeia archaeon]|jgi:pseudaminic acid synthase
MSSIKNLKIGKAVIGEGHRAYIIAEVGSNFDGSLNQTKKLVDLAKEAGADAVKFQSFLADKIISSDGFKDFRISFQAKWKKPVYQVYKEAEFPRDWHLEIAEYCKKKGITFFSTPYDREAVDLLDEIGVPAFKVGSGDINFLSLIEYIAKKGKPVIVGTGASSLGEVEEAVNTIRNAGNDQIVLLHCVTSYPSPIEQSNIRAMITLREAFQVNVGYSDHTLGDLVSLGAVALGGCIIEKHFTMDRTLSGPDHSFAMDFKEFGMMVNRIRLMENALGSAIKTRGPSENKTVVIQRRSVYAKTDIPEGSVITEDSLVVLRPDRGLKPNSVGIIVGRIARKNIAKGTPITWDML